MSIIITSKKDRKEIKNKSIINVGTNPKCDFFLKLDLSLIFSIQYNREKNIFQVTNNYRNPNILYEGETLNKVLIEKGACRITIKDTDEFIDIEAIANNDFSILSDDELRTIYGKHEDSEVRLKIEKTRAQIEKARINIIKQISYPINELKSKIRANNCASVMLHVGLYGSALLSSFALSNYLMGLTVQESSKNLYLATNVPIWIIFSIIVFGVGLMLKRGIYLHYTEKLPGNTNSINKPAKIFMLWASSMFILGIYTINLIYFSAMSEFFEFSLFITIFFVGIFSIFAIACGYYQANRFTYTAALNNYEFREDFEALIKTYRIWIERYINSLSHEKINNIKDDLFSNQIKATIETIIGILTAPFLAYGVSNTLAICFPEAANWVRISGFRFSPVFLILSTALIIFAFFSFSQAFTINTKLKASNVIKHDGYSDYRHHGVSIYGLEGLKKLESDKKMFLSIGCVIIFIEFMMNVSYFITEMGADFQGVFLSFVAAILPTALLLAETLILAVTKFDINNLEELISKLDKE